jgi:hypothetical protein
MSVCLDVVSAWSESVCHARDDCMARGKTVKNDRCAVGRDGSVQPRLSLGNTQVWLRGTGVGVCGGCAWCRCRLAA